MAYTLESIVDRFNKNENLEFLFFWLKQVLTIPSGESECWKQILKLKIRHNGMAKIFWDLY